MSEGQGDRRGTSGRVCGARVHALLDRRRRPGPRPDDFVLIDSGSAPGADVADAAAFRRAAVYWFQWISNRAEPMHLRRSLMSIVLSLAAVHSGDPLDMTHSVGAAMQGRT